MKKMIIKKIYIFSSTDKKAKVVEFSNGKNIITSSAIDGTDRGKSVIMKSIYHTLGADCFFDDKWNDDDKTYIVNFKIKSKEYYLYRCNKLFKGFDEKLNILFKTINRQELAAYLSDVFNFAVKLPKRDADKLEITPPAYNYLLYFLDQDKLSGTTFASFRNLTQYPNYKENVLFYHFGAFDENYYNIIRNLEILNEEKIDWGKKNELNEKMLEKVFSNIKDVSYSKSIDLLKNDVERTKEEYSTIAKKLSGIRKKLIELRNEKDDVLNNLRSLELIDKANEKHIKDLHNHICPICNSQVEDTIDLKINRYSFSDDVVLLSNDLQITVTEIDRKISKQETYYKEWLDKLSVYEESLSDKSEEINDVLKHKGYVEVRDGC